jgi:hypothetical protein
MASIDSMFDQVEPVQGTAPGIDPASMFDKVEPAEDNGPSDAYSFFGVQRGDLPGLARGIGDFFNGFNAHLASALKTTPSVVQDALALGHTLGLTDKTGKDAPSLVDEAFKRLGIAANPAVKSAAAQVGAGTFTNLMATAALMAGQPELATMAPAGTELQQATQMGLQTVARGATAAPAAAVAADVGAAAGAPAGAAVGGNVGGMTGGPDNRKAGEAIGGVVGGLMGGAATGSPFLLARPGGIGLPRVGGAEFGADLPKKPLLNLDNPADTTDIATRLAANKADITNLVDSLPKIGTSASDEEGARSLRGAVRTAYSKAQEIARKYWQDPNLQKLPVTTGTIKAEGAIMARSLPKKYANAQAYNIPRRALADIAKLPKVVPLGTLNRIQSAIDAERFDPATPRPLAAALGTLSKTIGSEMKTQHNGNPLLARANEMTSWIHQKFTDRASPVSDFARPSTPDSQLPSEAMPAATAMIKRQDPAQTLEAINARIKSPEIQQGVKDYVTSTYQTIAAERGPQAAVKWQRSPDTQRFIKQMPEFRAYMDAAGDGLNRAIEDVDAYNRNAFIKKFDADPKAAARTIFSGADPNATAKDLMARLGDDDAAKAALRQEVAETFLQRSNGNGEGLDAMKAARQMAFDLQNKPVRDALTTVLGPDGMTRLKRYATYSKRFSEGAEGAGTSLLRTIGPGAFKIASLKWLLPNAVKGGGAITAAGIKAKGAGFLFNKIMPTVDRSKIAAKALLDPNWEKFLYSKMPENKAEVLAKYKQMRALTAGLDATIESDKRRREQ